MQAPIHPATTHWAPTMFQAWCEMLGIEWWAKQGMVPAQLSEVGEEGVERHIIQMNAQANTQKPETMISVTGVLFWSDVVGGVRDSFL